MSTGPGTGTGGPAGRPDPAQIREEIERTRADLAGTVDALQSKLDVKARAKERVRATGAELRDRGVELREQATTREGRPRPEVLAAAAALVAVVVAVVWWRSRH